MRSLRIEKGLTYGVGGSFVPERFAGTFRIRTFTQTPRTAEAVAAILEQLAILRSGPPTAEELDVTQSYLVGSFAGTRESPQATVNDLWLIEYAHLPSDFLDRYLAGVRAADAAAVARVARELVHPDELTIVVVGDAAAVRADLEKLAPVTVVEK
jgi:zinc protease